MKRFLPLLVLAFGVVWALSTLRPPQNTTEFDLVGFGQLPVVTNGRVKPLDTVARNSLLLLQGRQRVSSPLGSGPLVSSPTEWLLDVVFRADKADGYPTFAIDNLELLSLLGKTEEDRELFILEQPNACWRPSALCRVVIAVSLTTTLNLS
jgi:hypothetical protein